jgi:hypothetical protein
MCFKQQVLFYYNIIKSWMSSMTNTLIINQVTKDKFFCNVLHFRTLKQMLNQPIKLNAVAIKSIVAKKFSSLMFGPFVFYKTYLVIPEHVLQS